MHASPRRKSHWRRRGVSAGVLGVAAAVAAVAAVAIAAWMFAPREDKFRTFDPYVVGNAEADLWRAYYEGRTADLAFSLAREGTRSFGLTPQASLQTAMAAANAARTFKLSRSREEAQAALPALTDYFRELAGAANLAIDPAEAARLELEWWQLRREGAAPEVYAPAVAIATGYVYGVEPGRLQRYAALRVEAMELRDSKNRDITEEDWRRISELLVQAYYDLRLQVSTPAPQPAPLLAAAPG